MTGARKALQSDSFLKTFIGEQKNRLLPKKTVLVDFFEQCIDLPGDTAECGVLYGASSYLICSGTQGTKKKHHIFDSFLGLSAPSKSDGLYWMAGMDSVPKSIVENNLSDHTHAIFHPGWIPERFAEVATNRFCFVHIDVPLYRPT